MAASRVNRFKEEFASEDVAPEDFLDSTEQEAMIKKFMEQNDSSNAWFQNIITLGAMFFALAKAYYMTSQIFFPWYLQPHALYSDSVPASIVSFWEFLSASAFAAVAFATHPSFGLKLRMRKLLHIFAGISYGVFFLTWFFYRGFDVGPELLWFVLGNVAIHALALYAEYLFAESHRQIEELKGVRYNYSKP